MDNDTYIKEKLASMKDKKAKEYLEGRFALMNEEEKESFVKTSKHLRTLSLEEQARHTHNMLVDFAKNYLDGRKDG